ncbi:hypothetical protein DWX04_22285, partial [Phocaeicola vulgatus]
EYKNAAVLILGLLFLFLYLSSPVVICKIINLIGLSVPKKDHLQDLILVMWKKMKETELCMVQSPLFIGYFFLDLYFLRSHPKVL